MKYKLNGLNELSKQFNSFVVEMGFDNNDIPLRIALIHSEVSEAFEAYRKDKYANINKYNENVISIDKSDEKFKELFENTMKDSFEDELADSIIRLLDLCGKLNINIEKHIELKMRYNEMRGYKFGGKKF
jgi:NTP pyrophosphatase (non-canonical NTP hydrolase)